MEDLLKSIKDLKKSDIGKTIDSRIKEFKKLGYKSNEELFKELCFCILTANFNAEKSIKIQDEIGECFLNDSEDELKLKLKKLGHRYPNMRADYIVKSRNCKDSLKKITSSSDNKAIRDWIVDNVKGLGYKESSHFLRNIGFDDYAIIDFHIIDILVKNNLIKRPKSLTKNKYLEIENILKEISKQLNLSLAELDLYLWYLETGKILK